MSTLVSSFQLKPGERMWDYSDPALRRDLEENWKSYLEGAWVAKYSLVSFEATYADRSTFEEAEFSDKEVELKVKDSDKIIFPDDNYFLGVTLQFGSSSPMASREGANIIELVNREELKGDTYEGYRSFTYSGELNRSTEDRFIITLDIDYYQNIDNKEDNPWGDKGKPNIIDARYRAVLIKEVEDTQNDSLYEQAIEKARGSWEWFKNAVSEYRFKNPIFPSATAGVRG